MTTGQAVRQYAHLPTTQIYDVAFSPDGNQLLTGGVDLGSGVRFVANVWDTQTGEQMLQLPHPTGVTNLVTFSPDGQMILTAHNHPRIAKLWDAQTGQAIREFSGHADWVIRAAFSPGGQTIVTASFDKTVRLWDVDYQTTMDYLCARLLRDFTTEERIQYGIPDDEPTCPEP